MHHIHTQIRTARYKLIVMMLSISAITLGCAIEIAHHDLSTTFGALFLAVIAVGGWAFLAAWNAYTRSIQKAISDYQRVTRQLLSTNT